MKFSVIAMIDASKCAKVIFYYHNDIILVPKYMIVKVWSGAGANGVVVSCKGL